MKSLRKEGVCEQIDWKLNQGILLYMALPPPQKSVEAICEFFLSLGPSVEFSREAMGPHDNIVTWALLWRHFECVFRANACVDFNLHFTLILSQKSL